MWPGNLATIIYYIHGIWRAGIGGFTVPRKNGCKNGGTVLGGHGTRGPVLGGLQYKVLSFHLTVGQHSRV